MFTCNRFFSCVFSGEHCIFFVVRSTEFLNSCALCSINYLSLARCATFKQHLTICCYMHYGNSGVSMEERSLLKRFKPLTLTLKFFRYNTTRWEKTSWWNWFTIFEKHTKSPSRFYQAAWQTVALNLYVWDPCPEVWQLLQCVVDDTHHNPNLALTYPVHILCDQAEDKWVELVLSLKLN